MPRALLLIPTTSGVGLNVIGDGLKRAIDHLAIKASFYKPISLSPSPISNPNQLDGTFSIRTVEHIVRERKVDQLLEEIVENYEHHAKGADLVVIQGINDVKKYSFAPALNHAMATALDASTIFVATPESDDPEAFIKQVSLATQPYQYNKKVLGIIINKINAPRDQKGFSSLDIDEPSSMVKSEKLIAALSKAHFSLAKKLEILGTIPWKKSLLSPRVSDVAKLIHANIISYGEAEQRRVKYISLCARSVKNILKALQPGNLIITPADRSDIIIATALAALSGVKIAALLLTGEEDLDQAVRQLCESAFSSGLPVLSVPSDSFRTALKLQNLYFEIPEDDSERIEKTREFIASYIKKEWITSLLDNPVQPHLSPPAFRHKIIEKARSAQQTILLPEGNDARILQAASVCAKRNIAKIILFGDPKEVKRLAKNNAINLNQEIKIINPDTLRDRYVDQLTFLRKQKGMTPPVARELLEEDMYLATMMLYNDEIDGVVSGAVHTTANTIRPALQIIKTQPKTSLVSSVFFMCLSDQVLVFGDCAINPDPNVQQLADIAIQSAETATHFGIDPKIAMISYSTGQSAEGRDVTKVSAATALVKEKRPDLLIDGPLQYDAAIIDSIAKKKAPNSPIAGQANVLIFPDLNTGNTTYKAVQRTADILSLGPILQGLNKPINDLSRGATVNDIVYTIAITAVQGIKPNSSSTQNKVQKKE